MLETIAIALRLDDFAVIQIIALAGVCGFVVSQLMHGWILPIACNVGLFASAYGANIVLRHMKVVITGNKDLDGIFYTTIGLTVGTVTVVLGLLLVSMISNSVGTTAQEMRDREQARRSSI